MKWAQPKFLRPRARQNRWNLFGALYGLLVFVTGLLLILPTAGPPSTADAPRRVNALTSGTVATLDSSPFRYDDRVGAGWAVSVAGADPREPSDPWREPSGAVEFEYVGRELALQIASGDYWGYLYVTVDGAPANRLPTIVGNVNVGGELAGYQTFYPPIPLDSATTPQLVRWLPVHQAADDGPHRVRLEVWRAWGQTPLRAVAVDAAAALDVPLWQRLRLPIVAWLAVLLLHGAVAAFGFAASRGASPLRPLRQRFNTLAPPPAGLLALGGVSVVSVGLGAALGAAWLCWLGLASLGLASLWRPALWTAALVLALPFYYVGSLPLLPGSSGGLLEVALLEVGLLGGLGVLAAHALLVPRFQPRLFSGRPTGGALALAALVVWSLATVATLSGPLADVALREWRTVFLAAGLFALIATATLHGSPNAPADCWLVVSAWLLGATVVALIALGQFATGEMVIEAEGVRRVRALYGSPNNLALYLERSAMVAVALMLFDSGPAWLPLRRDRDADGGALPQKLRGDATLRQAQEPRRGGIPTLRRAWEASVGASSTRNVYWALLALPQLLALRLTYSRGAIFLGVPAALIVLALGGWWLLRASQDETAQRRLRLSLWGVAILAGLGVLVVLPSFGAERFRGLLDLSRGTGFVRRQLWRSSLPMALDYPWWGVGLDGFLYAYRSGYLLPTAWQDPNLNHPHNFVLDGWTRLGLPGLMLLLTGLALGVRSLLRSLHRAATPSQAALALGLLAAVAASLAHGLIDASYALPDLMLVWVLLFTLLPHRASESTGG